MQYRNSTYADGNFDAYWFEKNLQGDIVAVYSTGGTKLVSYSYDAWGNITTTYHNGGGSTAAQYNPFRYRGYYYDSETGFYYLNSRYYDPKTCRFINADGELAGIGGSAPGYNLYAYCFNNPVNFSDPTGTWPDWGTLAKGALFATIGAMAVTAVVLSGGACTPLVAAGYAAMATGGVVAFAMGSAEVYESFTGTNPLRETMGDEAYDTMQFGAATLISFGFTLVSVSSSTGVCFVAGTLVETEIGSMPIEEISVGMKVYAHNPDTGETELKEVVNTFVRQSDELVHIKVNGEHIITTPEHPFYVPVKGWTSAIQLRAGDRLQLLNGKYVIIEQVQHELLETPVIVYNFEVEDFHTYYVSDSAILVHNTCGGATPKSNGPRHTSDQSALIDLAKEHKNGVTAMEADVLVGWAKEYGLNYHEPQVHYGRGGIWGQLEHIKIFNIHIPIK